MSLLTLLLPSIASAFTLISSNSSQMGWSDPNVVIQINPTNCPAGLDLTALVNDSAKIWNRVSTSKLKISAGDLSSNTAESSTPVIYCSTTFEADTGADADGTLGVATLSLSGNNVGRGRIALNVEPGARANISNFSIEQIKIVVAHEAGHLIGLGHSEYEYALMYYNIGAKDTLNLSQDDIDGVTYLYVRDEISDFKPLGCGAVSALPPSDSGAAQGLMFALLVLPLLCLAALGRGVFPARRRVPSSV